MLIDTSTPVSRRRRRRLAKGLRNLVRTAGEPPQWSLSSAIPVQREAVLYERGFILAIARDLDSDDEVTARGLDLISDLLTHGDSPVYADSPDGALARALAHAYAGLHLA
jgi:hypothetical protein